MMINPAAFLVLAAQCAPGAAPATLAALAQVESRFDPLALGVVRGRRPVPRPASVAQAARQARQILDAGGEVDLGLGQINSRNLRWLGLSLEQAFDPCLNLAASAKILSQGFKASLARKPDAQAALRMALSIYNTGDERRGFENGYVAKVEAAARAPLAPAPQEAPASGQQPVPAYTHRSPSLDVFASRARPALVFGAAPAAAPSPGDLP